MSDAYDIALARLLAAAERAMLPEEMKAPIAALRAGQVAAPAYLIAPAFLPDVGETILRRAAVRCIVWAEAENAIRAAERAQDGTQSDAMEAWHDLTDWPEAERQEAIHAACSAFREACPASQKEDKQLALL